MYECKACKSYENEEFYLEIIYLVILWRGKKREIESFNFNLLRRK